MSLVSMTNVAFARRSDTNVAAPSGPADVNRIAHGDAVPTDAISTAMGAVITYFPSEINLLYAAVVAAITTTATMSDAGQWVAFAVTFALTPMAVLFLYAAKIHTAAVDANQQVQIPPPGTDPGSPVEPGGPVPAPPTLVIPTVASPPAAPPPPMAAPPPPMAAPPPMGAAPPVAAAGENRSTTLRAPIRPKEWPLTEMLVATIAFTLWAGALPGSPFRDFGWYTGTVAGVVVLVGTTVAGWVASAFPNVIDVTAAA